MNKLLLVMVVTFGMFSVCCNSKPSRAARISTFEYIISPKIRGMQLVDSAHETVTYQANADLNSLVEWLDSSPIGNMAYPDTNKNDMYESIKDSLTINGKILSLIHDTYIFDISGEKKMVEVTVNLIKYGDVNKIGVKTILREIKPLAVQ